ncbi:hypothetical protein LEMLEM_LOCUS15566 [Lemmus lemmus]
MLVQLVHALTRMAGGSLELSCPRHSEGGRCLGHLAQGPEQVGDPGEWAVGPGRWISSARARARRLVRPWSQRVCPSGPSSTVRRAGSGAQQNRQPRWRSVSGVRCPVWVFSVCSLGRVSGGRRIGEFVIDVPRASSGKRIGGDLAVFLGKLWGPGSVCAHAVSVYIGRGQVQPAEATCEGLGPLQLLGPGLRTSKSAPIQGSLLTGQPSRQKPVSAHTELHERVPPAGTLLRWRPHVVQGGAGGVPSLRFWIKAQSRTQLQTAGPGLSSGKVSQSRAAPVPGVHRS